MKQQRLSKSWLYIFIIIAIISFGVFIAALIMKAQTEAIAMGIVTGIQIFNIIKWKKGKSI